MCGGLAFPATASSGASSRLLASCDAVVYRFPTRWLLRAAVADGPSGGALRRGGSARRWQSRPQRPAVVRASNRRPTDRNGQRHIRIHSGPLGPARVSLYGVPQRGSGRRRRTEPDQPAEALAGVGGAHPRGVRTLGAWRGPACVRGTTLRLRASTVRCRMPPAHRGALVRAVVAGHGRHPGEWRRVPELAAAPRADPGPSRHGLADPTGAATAGATPPLPGGDGLSTPARVH